MTPPISTYHQIVRLERAAALARAEKTRATRDQELVLLARVPNQADREVGLVSSRARLARRANLAGARRERVASPAIPKRVAPAHR